jgi:DNA-directed RNA polymerase specialized sigma24 family protein
MFDRGNQYKCDMDKGAGWLAKVAERHSEWVKIVNSFGEYEYDEDIVQECYLTLYKYADEEKIIKNGVVSRGYLYFALRSLYFQYYNSKKKIDKVYLDDEEYTQQVEYSDTMDEEVAYNKICQLIDEHIEGWRWYEKKLFILYRDSPLSIRGIAAETGISWVSIYHTLKHAKQELKDKLGEDYDDYKNNDYELI